MRIFRFFIRYWRSLPAGYSQSRFLLVMAFSMLGGFLSTGLLAMASQRLSLLNEPQPVMAWVFFGLALVLPIALMVAESMLLRISQDSIYDLNVRFCRQVLSAPVRKLEAVGSHRLLNIIAEDVHTISEALTSLISTLTHSGILVAGMVFLAVSNWKFALLVFAFLIFGLLVYLFFATRGWACLKVSRGLADDRFGHYRAITEGNKELKLHRQRRREFLEQLFLETGRDYNHWVYRGHLLYSIAKGWGQSLYFLLIGLFILVLPHYTNIPQSVMLTYTFVILIMLSPLQLIMDAFYVMGKADVAVARVESLGLDLQEGRTDEDPLTKPAAPNPGWQRLNLEQLRFTYREANQRHPFEVGPVDLEIRPGEITFIIGGNGSGKTTLAKLLIGLYEPTEGTLTVDGKPLSKAAYREFFSMVFADFFLFDKLLGLDSEDRVDMARQYLAKFQMDKKVAIEDGAWSTTHLSQGQRKRLALLTAYLEDRPVYIFDEWAADQDPVFREIFYTHLLPELKRRGKAIVCISHDEAYFNTADRIVRLEYGQLEYDLPVAQTPYATVAS